MWLLRHKHKSMIALVGPRTHSFIEITNLQWGIDVLIVFIKGIWHLTDILELAYIQSRLLFGVDKYYCDLEEVGLLHILF